MKLGKLLRRGLIAFLSVIFLLSAAIVGAAVQIFDGTGQYIMSDDLDHEFGKKRAQQRAERDAQKKAGVALKTFSRSINSELADDAVSAVVNNIIQVSDVKIVPVPFEANGEAGIMYKATLKATIDTDGIYAWIKRDDKEKVTIIQQNDSLQAAIQKNDELAESLQEQYKKATTQTERDSIIKQMNDADRDFLANQKYEEGLKLYYERNFNGAIQLYSEALEINPNFAEAYTNRGNAYGKLRQYKPAIQDFNKSIEINPNFDRAYYNRGLVHDELGQTERAIQDYSKAIELNPNYEWAYCNRGVAYYDLGQFERAIEDYTQAIKINSNDELYYNNRGNAYFQLFQYKLAIKDYDKAIELNPKYSTAYRNRGLCHREFGNNKKADADFEKARQLENVK